MKKLLIAFIIMLSVSCGKEDITVTNKTTLPNEVVKILTDSTIKYNQTTVTTEDYLYVIENKVVIKRVGIDDLFALFLFGVLMGFLIGAFIVAVLNND